MALRNRPVNRQISNILGSTRRSSTGALTRSVALGSSRSASTVVDPSLTTIKTEPESPPSSRDSPRLPAFGNSGTRRRASSQHGSSFGHRSQTSTSADSPSSVFATPYREFAARENIGNDVEEYDDGTVKLKGIRWPGMSLFDSATAIDRRRRNQKKDDSVIRRLRDHSQMVECTELTFNPDWTLNKERFIDGLPSSSPPVSPSMSAMIYRDDSVDPVDLDNDMPLDHEDLGPFNTKRYPVDSVAATAYGQGRYNLRQEVCLSVTCVNCLI
jgi:hypothetical protein